MGKRFGCWLSILVTHLENSFPLFAAVVLVRFPPPSSPTLAEILLVSLQDADKKQFTDKVNDLKKEIKTLTAKLKFLHNPSKKNQKQVQQDSALQQQKKIPLPKGAKSAVEGVYLLDLQIIDLNKQNDLYYAKIVKKQERYEELMEEYQKLISYKAEKAALTVVERPPETMEEDQNRKVRQIVLLRIQIHFASPWRLMFHFDERLGGIFQATEPSAGLSRDSNSRLSLLGSRWLWTARFFTRRYQFVLRLLLPLAPNKLTRQSPITSRFISANNSTGKWNSQDRGAVEWGWAHPEEVSLDKSFPHDGFGALREHIAEDGGGDTRATAGDQ